MCRAPFRRTRRHAQVAAIATCGLLTLGVAQTAAEGQLDAQAAERLEAAQSPRRGPSPEPDFLIGRPRSAVGLRGSWLFARAESELFDFIRDQLTVDHRDFNAPGIVIEYAGSLTSRFELVGGFEFTRARVASEYRDFVDNNRLPIEQVTALSTTRLTASLRAYLTSRGREVSQLAWVPTRATPYVGAGAGIQRYDLQQSGDFVDAVTFNVFSDTFRSVGWVPTTHVFGGLNVRVFRSLFFATEGRYAWASAELSDDFVGFDALDLAGFQLTGGINVVF